MTTRRWTPTCYKRTRDCKRGKNQLLEFWLGLRLRLRQTRSWDFTKRRLEILLKRQLYGYCFFLQRKVIFQSLNSVFCADARMCSIHPLVICIINIYHDTSSRVWQCRCASTVVACNLYNQHLWRHQLAIAVSGILRSLHVVDTCVYYDDMACRKENFDILMCPCTSTIY
jgi:hypothetical protein